VFRIGSDALGTARAIRDHLLVPALDAAGLPRGAVNLVDSSAHAAGWALFDDPRLALAVARGSGFAVGQLGEIARQCGVPVSLHGTGGAWLVVGTHIPEARLTSAIVHSLDRKVCNTLNTIVVLEDNKAEALRVVTDSLASVAERRSGCVVVHAPESIVAEMGDRGGLEIRTDPVDPGEEWEWDDVPEVTVIVSQSIADAVSTFNRQSPRFIISVLSDDDAEVARAWETSESPFFGDGFTRWVDGQFALERPELGLANWQFGRLLGRGGVLSGDAVHSVRLRVRQSNPDLHR
jgi:glutamate-5-semialdehyde dehydrogenase